jgi:hypothetical protein
VPRRRREIYAYVGYVIKGRKEKKKKCTNYTGVN